MSPLCELQQEQDFVGNMSTVVVRGFFPLLNGFQYIVQLQSRFRVKIQRIRNLDPI